MKKVKYIGSVFPLVTLALTACGGGAIPPGGGPASNFGASFSRDVKVTGWTSAFGTGNFTDTDVTAQIGADGSGKMVFNALTSPPTQTVSVASYLPPVSNCSPAGLAITGDTKAFDLVSSFYSDAGASRRVYTFALANDKVYIDPTDNGYVFGTGGVQADFYNVAQTVTVKGSATCGTAKVNLDVTLAAGWNLVTTTYNGNSSWTVKNDVETGLNWRVLGAPPASLATASAGRSAERTGPSMR